MNKRWTLFCTIVLCLALTACNANQTADQADDKNQPALALSATATNTPKEDFMDQQDAYATALQNLLKNHTLPDGTDCGFEPSYQMADNQFAIYDIDQDDKEELLIMYSTTFSAGMTGCVLAYDSATKELQTELQEFPLLTFYDNGIVKADWSHNQGLAGDFWPYSLYQYAPDSDQYVRIGMVNAWSKDFSAIDSQGNPFPDTIDTSGTGVVYYIITDDNYEQTTSVDVSAYKEWINFYLENASELEIPYLALTEENIAHIKNE